MGEGNERFKASAWGAVDSAVGAGMGLLLGGINDRRQLKQQGRLNEQQMKYQKMMAEFNNQMQYDMWQKTGFKGQMEQMKKAGLNPSLMYGMGGAGGQSIGSGGGSGPSGASAPSGGGEAMGMMQTKMQMSLLDAQRKNIEADTEQKKATTEKTGTDNIGSGLSNELKQMELELGSMTFEARKERIKIETDKALSELGILQNEGIVRENTTMDRVAMIGAELVGMEIRNELSRVMKDKTFSDIEVNKAQIQNFLVQQEQNWFKLSLDERNTKVQELLGEFNTSLSREALGAVGGVITTILSRGLKQAK